MIGRAECLYCTHLSALVPLSCPCPALVLLLQTNSECRHFYPIRNNRPCFAPTSLNHAPFVKRPVKVASSQCRSEADQNAMAKVSLPSRGQKVKSLFVAPNRCHLTLGIPCSRCHNCCKSRVQARLVHFSLPLLGAKAQKTQLFEDKSLLPPYLLWPTDCQTSWVPNHTIPRLQLWPFGSLYKYSVSPGKDRLLTPSRSSSMIRECFLH